MTDRNRIKYCEVCLDTKKNPPCGNCEYGTPPDLLPENEEAFDLWMEVRTQFRGAGFSIIGLDYQAVRDEAEDMGLSFSGSLKRKIKALERHTVESQGKNRKDDKKTAIGKKKP